MFANNTLIALVVHSIKKGHIFYFDWVIFAAMFIILFNEIYKKKC